MLPAAEPSELGFKEPEIIQPDAKGNGERVLVLQREDGERGMMVRYLRHIGFAPIAAGAREEAALILREQRVAVAIIDNGVVDSPDENIVDVVRKIAGNEQLPVVLVTSRAFVFDIEKYLKAGVDRCLVKPIQLKELGHIARSLIDGVYSGDVIDRSELQDKIPNAKLASKPGEVLH
jgi:DNA-binding response OmpR family regulator